jgi:hypothetical protein
LLWQDGSVINGAQTVSITGQADLVLSGTIYAPQANVTIAGGSKGSGCTVVIGQNESCLAIQLIALSWKISGGGAVDMPYDPNELYHVTQTGLVH